ncbi:type II secretion system protein [Puniceicoccus vermicola]|uniref:Type II secretion system protein n=2 Tax=Puniceicoccus vermicola TaxID=388746 RepID=A0A7X1AYY9_9BACT|nr:type II secretion system protein [Puniceicoccus vermicola]
MTPHPKEPPKSAPLPRGFTLIELLTVIAVLGILTAILLPVFGKMRESADHAKNINNLRQLGSAFHLYAQDNGGRLPLIFHIGSDPSAYWRRATLAYAERNPDHTSTRDDLFNSPFTSPVIVDMIEQNGGRPYVTSYAMNERLRMDSKNEKGQRVEVQRPLVTISDPSNTILATEGPMGPGGEKTIPDFSVYEPTLLANLPQATYKGGRDALMVDGSVRFFEKWDEMALPPYNSGGEKDLWNP